MKSGSYFNGSLNTLNNSERSKNLSAFNKLSTKISFNNNNNNTDGYSDRESVASSARGKRTRSRVVPMKASKNISKKTKTMDYTNYAYNEAVGRLKLMLADSYAPLKTSSSYMRNINDDSDNFSDNLSVVERPVMSEISKYLSTSYKNPRTSYRSKYKSFQPSSVSKENLTTTTTHYTPTPIQDYAVSSAQPDTNIVQAPAEIFNFIEKQEDYIEQLEKESKFCRNELSNLLGKVKDVISENEALTDNARSELAGLGEKVSASSESEDNLRYCKSPKKREKASPRYSGGPSIVYESKISQLEAELAQSNIDLRKVRGENEDLKRKLSYPVGGTLSSSLNCETHRKQIETLQMDKVALEENIRQLQKTIDEMKASNLYGSSKRYANDLERSHSELEIKHLREELDRQHERVRELQHEMARRISDERANAERRYNNQVDQLGGDLSTQWDQVTKLQLDLERQKRLESDLKRDLSQRNAQIDELKMELKANRTSFLSDIAQVSAEKQSLEQEITSLRLQLDRSERQGKVETSRLTAEISSLRQRLDRADADLLHSKREVLRLNDEIANLEKELAYGEMKNEIRPTKKDLDKRISEIQEKHADTVVELEEMIQSQKQLMDKLTTECKTLTKKLEDTTLKNKTEISALQSNVEYLTNRVINNDRIGKIDSTPTSYSSLPPITTAPLEYKPSYSTESRAALDSEIISSPPTTKKPSPYSYESSINPAQVSDDYLSTEPKKSLIEPRTTTTTNYESTLGNYDYGDDENQKDSLGEGEKHRNGGDIQPTNDYSAKSSIIDQSAKPLSTDTKQFDKDDYQVGDPANQLYAPESANPATDYSTEYTGYDGYEQQPYTGTGYDQTYDRQYDGTQAYEGTPLDQYDGSQQQYDTNQYGDYGAQDYEQPYQSQYESTLPTDVQAPSEISEPTTELPPVKSSPPVPTSTSAGITPVTGTRPSTESRTQPRPGNSTLGTAGAGTNAGNKLATPLSQQPAATAKGLSGGRKD
ncbi:serologically defined colon cancer antigen 8 homolog isoform X2 [Episyrphus balteatus]|uniref:serologically defined colon cancer antigen 8 homolog isoform X2 n=1 Tax=Episyrphus balteatus TaxID=286459 RepID=UPI002485BA85|nr:serologically defined colon cancer antigen 8 homolog isoform X2 [Episyrphus balteatus]